MGDSNSRSEQYTQSALRHLHHLTVEIGERGSTTPQERRAAEYALRVFENLKLEARMESFRSGRSTYYPFVLAFGLPLLAALFYAITRQPAAALATAFLSALGAWGMFSELDLGDNWMRRLLPTGGSQNVTGVVPPRQEARRRIVLAAHIDTHRTPVFYSSTAWHRIFVTLVSAAFVSLVLGTVIYLLLAISGWGWLHILAAAAAAVQIFALAMCLHADLTPYTPGANDNGSGTATVLALAERLQKEPLRNSEVWLVTDGCEEVGCYGAAALVDAHADELRQAYLIAVDIVGVGDPAFLASDGLLKKYPVDAQMLSIARQVVAGRPELQVFEHPGLAYTDAALFLKRGYRAFTVDALPRAALGGSGWHQMGDTYEKIDPDCLRRAHEFIWEMLQQIDRLE